MPVPLIELQRRLSLVGAIRAGGEKEPKRPGRKLDSWRVTSARQQLVEQAAELYGGEVTPWESPVGQEWQCYTTSAELPVLVMPSYSLRQTYELWEGATKRLRLCDGIDEELSGGPCVCNATGDERCDLYTRLVVALPELDTLLGWRVITRGVNAAHELPTMIDAARAATSSAFVPARLRLEQRRGVVDGQVARFVVPTLDLGVGYAALMASAVDGSALALEAGGGAALPPVEPSRTPDVEKPDASPAPTPEASGPDEPPAEPQPRDPQTYKATKAQKGKLDVLVGTLRERGEIATDGLYNAIGHEKLRNIGGLDIAMTTPDYVDDAGVVHKAIDEAGVTHWAPLRETLTRQEAHQLIEWLTKVEARPKPESDAGDGSDAQAGQSDGTPEPDDAPPDPEPEKPPPVPYNEFPEGY